jgi:hypothetical protein
MEPITSNTPAAAPAATTAAAAPTKSNEKAQEQKNQFLQLLVAQLKGQKAANSSRSSHSSAAWKNSRRFAVGWTRSNNS